MEGATLNPNLKSGTSALTQEWVFALGTVVTVAWDGWLSVMLEHSGFHTEGGWLWNSPLPQKT